MADTTALGPWIRRFLLEHLVQDRNLARNTQRSYRDTLVLLFSFLTRKLKKTADRLNVIDLTPDLIRAFLLDLEDSRHCGVRTRNQRLAAIRSLARFIAIHSPEHIVWSGQIRSIPLKKATQTLIPYLEKAEIEALVQVPDPTTGQGRRDQALLLFLYNSGARADEAAQLTIADLDLAPRPQQGQSSVKLFGKGRKVRSCPLWPRTASLLIPLTAGRAPTERVFLNRYGRPMTRFGIHNLVRCSALRASETMPSLASKRVSPHTLRHTTATHLLRAGVDINTVRAWLGHVSLNTTHIYAQIDLQMKAKALLQCGVPAMKSNRRWKEDANLMAFLRAL